MYILKTFWKLMTTLFISWWHQPFKTRQLVNNTHSLCRTKMIDHTNSTGLHASTHNASSAQLSTRHVITGQQDSAQLPHQLHAGFTHNPLNQQNRPPVIQHTSSATPQNMAAEYNAYFQPTHTLFPHHNFINPTQLPPFSQTFGINNYLYTNDGRQMYLNNPPIRPIAENLITQ